MKKAFLILIAVLFASAVQAQLPFTYEVKKHGGLYYAYFYKKNSISDKDLIIQYRMVFPTNRSSQSRMATILSMGSQDRSLGVNEWFEIQITSYDVRDGGAYSGSSSSSSSSSGSSSGASSGITRADVPAEYWGKTDVDASDVVWAEANVGADSPEGFGIYIYTRHLGPNSACLNGWRPPTSYELRSLASSKSEWTKVNGVEGRLFHTGSQEVFLPAAGYEGGIDAGKKGYYRSDTGVSGEDEFWTLIFGGGKPRVKGFHRGSTTSLRCVRK